ncbi:MAG TPA: TonB-dependent receptor plug domain-containing protein, partial [Opitutaceae bacterium]
MTYLTIPPYRRPRSLFTAFVATGTLLAGSALAQDAADQGEDVITLPEFAVSTAVDTGYMATNTTSGTRVATEIINLPYSIQVLTEDFFKDFNLYDLDEMVPYVSNLAAGDPAAGGGGGTRLRGFFVPYFRNGFYRRQAPDSNSIARVEVVKGPQSAIYGRVSPGGVINFISKKPQTKFHTGLTQSFGSYDYSRTDAYVTGPLVANKLYYRVDAAYYDMNRPTDFWYNRTTNASGGLTWKLSSNTSLTFEYEYTGRIMNDTQTFMRWIGPDNLIQATVADLPDRALAERLMGFNSGGAHRRTERLNDSYYVQFEHRFDPELSLRANVGYSTREFERLTPTSLGTWDFRNNRFSNVAGTARTGRSMSYQTIDDKQYGAQIDLTKMWRGDLKQRSLFTFDVFQDDTDQETWGLSGTALNNALSALGMTTTAQQDVWKYPDPFDPGYGYLVNPEFHGVPGWTRTGTEAANTFGIERFYYGALFNHTAEFLHGRLAFTGSLRQDWAEFTRRQPYAVTQALKNAKGSAEELTYSSGVNYHVIPRKLVGFVSYGTAFDPAPQTDPNTGDVLGNKTAKGVELGVKGILMDNTLSYTLSAYRVQQENEVTDNPEW